MASASSLVLTGSTRQNEDTLLTTTGSAGLITNKELVRPTKQRVTMVGAARRAGVQTVSTTVAVLKLNAAVYGGMESHGDTGTTSKVTIAASGIYMCALRSTVGYSSSTATLFLRVDDVDVIQAVHKCGSSANSVWGAYAPLLLSAGQVVTAAAKSSASRDMGQIDTGVYDRYPASQTALSVVWLGRSG